MRTVYFTTAFLIFLSHALFSRQIEKLKVKGLPPNAIVGSATPAKIPDATVLRLVLVSLSSNGSNAMSRASIVHQLRIKRLMLSNADELAIEPILDNFAKEYAGWTQRTTTNLSLGLPIDLQERDRIAAGAMSTIQERLTPVGLGRLKAYLAAARNNIVLIP